MNFIKSVLRTTTLASTATLAVVMSSGISAIALDFRLNSVSGTWNNPIGGTNITGIGTNEIRWGIPVNRNLGNSGLRFDGAAPPSVTVNNTSNFVLGELTHFNFVTRNAGNSVDLDIALNLENVQPTFKYKFNLDETENNVPLASCPPFQKSIDSCDDRITFSSSNIAPTTFSVSGQDYTLELVGFSNTPDGSSPISQFITQESIGSKAFLIGRITTPQATTIPEPATMAGLFMLSSYFLNRRHKNYIE